MELKEDFLKNYFEGFKNLFPDLTVEQLGEIYDQDKYTGYPVEPGGSVWHNEGRSIYCLIRLLKPKRIIEIGNYLGRSSSHILQAVEDNGVGEVVLLDLYERLEYDRLHNKKFERVIDDSLKYLQRETLVFDLYVQDGCHEYEHVSKELELMTSRTQNDFMIWAHDWFTVRPPECEVKRAWDDHITKFVKYSPMKDSVSNCGCVIAEYKKNG